MRVVHELNVKVHGRVDYRVGVQMLRLGLVGLAYVNRVVIEQRCLPNQAGNDALNLRHAHDLADRRWRGVELGQRCASRRALQPTI